MKKTKKMICVLCLICLLLPLLCGCKELDEMRAKQAYYDADGNILWNDAVYKKLPQGEYFQPNTSYSYENLVYVTDPDVPVLLKEMFNEDTMRASEDGLILKNASDIDFGDGRYGYYCREDRHAELSEKLRGPFPAEMVCYTYSVYDPNEGEYGGYVKRSYRLSQEQRVSLQRITELVEPTVIGDGWNLSYDYRVELYECSEDMLFQRYAMSLSVSGDTYYLWVNKESDTEIYQVPDTAVSTVAKILEQYISDKEGEEVYIN